MGTQGSNQHSTKAPQGTVVDVGSGTEVTRPNGVRVVVGGSGQYVLDAPGDHVTGAGTDDQHTYQVG